MKTSHPFFFGSPAAPSHLHSSRVPVLICSACSCGGGGWQVLFDLIGGFGDVKLDVMPVSAGVTRNIILMSFNWNPAPQRTLRTQSQTNKILCDLCDLCGEPNNEKQPSIFSSAILLPLLASLYRVPVLICCDCPCDVGAGRRFSIISAGFECELG